MVLGRLQSLQIYASNNGQVNGNAEGKCQQKEEENRARPVLGPDAGDARLRRHNVCGSREGCRWVRLTCQVFHAGLGQWEEGGDEECDEGAKVDVGFEESFQECNMFSKHNNNCRQEVVKTECKPEKENRKQREDGICDEFSVRVSLEGTRSRR